MPSIKLNLVLSTKNNIPPIINIKNNISPIINIKLKLERKKLN